MDTRTKEGSTRIVQLNLCMHIRIRHSLRIESPRYMMFNFGAHKLRPKSLNQNHGRFVHVPDVSVLLLLVKSSKPNTFAGRDSPSETPKWEGGRIFRSLERQSERLAS